METELKLLVNPSDIESVKSLRALADVPGETGVLINRYFDTDDHQLASRNMAVRLRLQGAQWLQTLKGSGATTGGLHQRPEWEMPVASDALEWDRLPNEELPAALVRERVRVQFETQFERTTWLVKRKDATIEVALDTGHVSAGGAEEPLCELELELKDGDTEALFALAETIASEVPVLPSDINKAERGYYLIAGTRRVPDPPTAETELPEVLGALARQAEQLPESSSALAETIGILVDREILHVGLGQAILGGLVHADTDHWYRLPDARRLGQWLLHAAHQWHAHSVTEC